IFFFVEETSFDTTCCPASKPRGGVNEILKINEYLKPVHKIVIQNTLRRLLVLVKEKSNTQRQSHDTENYPGSDLLSLGVLRPVPEQYLRISLTRVQSPLRTLQHPAPQLVFLHNRREQHPGYHTRSSFTTEGNNTLDTPPGLPSQPKGTTQEK
ncbi:hypothetical protein Taro_034596, partial [Colocasia esculenta]|nr:hypothetical protein [Colocasia esculenta]